MRRRHTGWYTWRQQRRRIRVDRSTFFDAIVAVLPKGCSVIDLGAGPGTYVRKLRELGHDVVGFDGTAGIEKMTGGLVHTADLTVADFDLCEVVDWAICIDVGEHVPSKHEGSLLDNIGMAAKEGLILSWGTPGTRGSGHVNCRTLKYVMAEMLNRGWFANVEARLLMRPLLTRREYNRTMVYRRE